ncbi:MAG: 50S ribosomal protein L6 [Candidatus Cloacimonadia bacterium]
MSRVGKAPINIPENVTVDIKGKNVTVSGPKGTLTHRLNEGISVKIEDKQIIVGRVSDQKEYKSMHGLNRALLYNIVKGVSEGYMKRLMIVGTGYRAEVKGRWLILGLGFSHDVYFEIPEGIEILVERIGRADASAVPELQSIIDVKGIDKELVGNVAATIRKIRPPEPYKSKGIRYADEHIRRKAGKIAGGTGA